MMDHDQILPNLFVGTYPKSVDDILELQKSCRVTAILNLQTDEDLRERSIHWPAMEAFYEQLGIEPHRVPMRDFDHDHQKERLPEAVEVLAGLLSSGHVVYLHCNAGIGRSPLVAMAYLYWVRNMKREEAIDHVRERRYCAPYEDLLESGRGDDLVGR